MLKSQNGRFSVKKVHEKRGRQRENRKNSMLKSKNEGFSVKKRRIPLGRGQFCVARTSMALMLVDPRHLYKSKEIRIVRNRVSALQWV